MDYIKKLADMIPEDPYETSDYHTSEDKTEPAIDNIADSIHSDGSKQYLAEDVPSNIDISALVDAECARRMRYADDLRNIPNRVTLRHYDSNKYTVQEAPVQALPAGEGIYVRVNNNSWSQLPSVTSPVNTVSVKPITPSKSVKPVVESKARPSIGERDVDLS